MTICLGIMTFLFGCVSTHFDWNVSKEINAIVLKHEPYCGGANPNKIQEAGNDIALSNTGFFIKKGTTNHDTIPILREVTTDTLGRFSILLDTGTYTLIFRDKHQSFEGFYKQKSLETKVLKAGAIDCFKSWWQTPDAVIHISDTTTTVQCIIATTCHTEFNPCMYYLGPKRP